MDNLNTSQPFLGQDRPAYPLLYQLLRVTGATVPGPTGGTSTGPGVGNVPPSVLYVASTQQLRTDTLAPRDREPCMATDPNNIGLIPWYYLGRLAGSYNGLPVYEVIGSTPSGSSFPQGTGALPGLTPAQQATLNASLTPVQISNLNNLNACQLQALLQLPVVNIQLIGNMTPTQVSNLLDSLTYTQLTSLVTTLTPAQQSTLSTALTANQVQSLVEAGLTPIQIQALVTGLTTPQLQLLASIPPPEIFRAVTDLTTAQLISFLNKSPLPETVSAVITVATTVQFDSVVTALANVTGLSVDLSQSRTYTFRAILRLTTDTTGGFNIAVNYTGTTTSFITSGVAFDLATPAFATAGETLISGSTVVTSSGTTKYAVEVTGSITVKSGGAGTLTVQFAQSTANGTSSVLKGSSLQVTQVQ